MAIRIPLTHLPTEVLRKYSSDALTEFFSFLNHRHDSRWRQLIISSNHFPSDMNIHALSVNSIRYILYLSYVVFWYCFNVEPNPHLRLPVNNIHKSRSGPDHNKTFAAPPRIVFIRNSISLS
jgi:hypothetical protein